MKKEILIFVLAIFVFSCGSRKTVTTKKAKSKTKTERITEKSESKSDLPKAKSEVQSKTKVYANAIEEYIATYSAIAQEEMRLYYIPASITLAQGILESGSGTGRLSVEANNHFGIKCHDWTGAKIYHDDDSSQECFRKYNNSKYSFRDHSLFLSNRKRYSKLFNLKTGDYKGWAKGLRAAGYATDKKYPQKLISLIERYELYRFDTEIIGKSTRSSNKHIVQKGDTLYSISKKFKVSVAELQDLNNLEGANIHIGQVLNLKP